MNDTLKAALDAYTKANRAKWKADRESDEWRKKIDDSLAIERRVWTKAVKGLQTDARDGWTSVHIKGKCEFIINHSTTPCTGFVHVVLEAYYAKGNRRGSLRLSGMLGEADEVLKEARRILCR